MPGEAAYYTASALIDGFDDYQRLDFGANVQAAKFGPTIMMWYTSKDTLPVQLGLTGSDAYVQVDVVGRVTPLEVNAETGVTLTLSDSPIYVLAKDTYEQLTALGTK